ncbi:methyl-accepting chemotaxis protein [Conexibacter sp. SYSU D00693]|uniref:methyl-accepting chemotaxis protein n=1 Tax=Conexibacter sp. SYSU D00693 TaxID=2812560 RepID=UPI00196B4800|nr:methyl-accepting chemotaxis protein [Conexibacter sp. SYSU D00693]
MNRRTSLRAKLLGLSGLLLAFTALIGVLSLSKLAGAAHDAEAQYQKAADPLSHLGDAFARTNENRAFTNNIILEDDPAVRAEVLQKLEANSRATTEDLAEVRPTLVTPEGKALFAALVRDRAAYSGKRKELFALAETATDDAAYAFNKAQVVPLATKVNTHFRKLFDSKVEVADTLAEETQAAYRSARTLLVILLALALAIGFGAAFVLSAQIRKVAAAVLDRMTTLRERDTTELATGLERFAGGDLTYRVAPETRPIGKAGNDELGDVARAVDAVIENTVSSVHAYDRSREALSGMIGQVSQTAALVSAASQQVASASEETGRAVGEISRAVEDVATGSQRQVVTLDEARTASQEAAGATAQSAESARETAMTAERARAATTEGEQAVAEATEAMSTVRAASDRTTDAIRELGAKSDEIGGIVDTITSIAEQTNLLALNAAIEAARAGEQGRGFAVVADEVRKLAEESQGAAASIASLITEIQADTGRAVAVVEDGSRATHDSVATVERAREAFQTIGGSVEEVTAQVTRIAEAADRMSSSVHQVTTQLSDVAAVAEESSASTEQVSASTQQTSASSQEIAASAQELAGNAAQLEELTRRFVLETA